MQFLRSAAIDARVRFTASRRKQQLRELCDEGNAPMFVAFYHRVADSHPNDWSISKAEFRRHIDYCRENFQMIGLDELHARVQQHSHE